MVKQGTQVDKFEQRFSKGEVTTTPYGKIDVSKYVYVFEENYDVEGYVPPTTWVIMDALGNFMYFKSRSRDGAQKLCDEFFGKGKYTVRSDRFAKGR